jgi:hypothetical protein
MSNKGLEVVTCSSVIPFGTPIYAGSACRLDITVEEHFTVSNPHRRKLMIGRHECAGLTCRKDLSCTKNRIRITPIPEKTLLVDDKAT